MSGGQDENADAAEDLVPGSAPDGATVPLPYQSLDGDGRIVAVNDAWLDHLGYEREDVLGQHFTEFLAPGSASVFRERFQSVLADGTVTDVELRIVTGTNDELEVVYDGRVEYDDAGAVDRTHCQFRDVTTEREATRRLEQYRAVLDHSTDAILIADPESMAIVDANRTACRRLGYSRSELLAVALGDIQPDIGDAEDWRDHFDRIRAAGSIKYEGEHRRKDGSRFPVEVEISHVELGGEAFVVGIARDLTDRRKREQDLARFDAALDTIEEATYVIDESFEVVYANRALSEQVGLELADIVGSRCYSVAHGRQEPCEGTHGACPLGTVFEAGEAAEEMHRHVDARGRPRWVEITATPITDDGEVTAMMEVMTDVTDRVGYEQNLERVAQAARDLLEDVDGPVSRPITWAINNGFEPVCAVFFGYESGSNTLVPEPTEKSGWTVADLEPISPGDHPLWRAYVGGERLLLDGDAVPDSARPAHGAVAEHLLTPVGDHGVLLASSAEPEYFDGRGHNVVTTLASTAEAALNRRAQAERIQASETALERANEHLRELIRVNETVRRLIGTLLGVRSETAVQETVLERLAPIEGLAFGWYGEPVAGNPSRIEPIDWMGEEAGYLGVVSLGGAGDEVDPEPAVAAAHRREPVSVGSTESDVQGSEWRAAALSRDFRSVLAVPVEHGQRIYGVLTLYATAPEFFAGQTRSVFVDLGDAMGRIRAHLGADRVRSTEESVELVFELPDSASRFSQLARALGATLVLERLVRTESGAAVAARTPAAAGEVEAVAGDIVGIEELVITDHTAGETRVEFSVAEEPIVSSLLETGAIFLEQTLAQDGSGRMTVRVSAGEEASRMIESFLDANPGVALRARRPAPPETTASGDTDPLADLTPRQREVLAEAYAMGYFQTPRAAAGEAVADRLDMATSSFFERLRLAQANLYAALFEDQPP